MRTLTAHNCRCECGAVKFAATREPLFRMMCHCSICQDFNNAAFSDFVVYRRSAILEPAARLIEFETYRAPPNIDRGKCRRCGVATIEIFDKPLLPALVMIPKARFAHGTALPKPVGHIFYESRVDNAEDVLPKHIGYLASQFSIAKQLLPAMMRAA